MDDGLRFAVAMAGTLAMALLLWRLIGHWLDTPPLVHLLGALLVTSLAASAAATAVNASNDAPANPVLWLILFHRLLCVAVALAWPVWVERPTV